MTTAAVPDTVCLFEVDNTLLDNDAIVDDLRDHLVDAFGHASAERCWVGFEALRSELGYADYLGALQRYRVDAANHPKLLAMSVETSGSDEFAFEYGDAFAAHLEAFGPTFAKVLVHHKVDFDSALNARRNAQTTKD